MYHPHTVIYSNFTFRYKLENIPEPCYIVIDIPDIISIDLPTIFIQLEPNIIIDNENYLLENFHKYERIYTFNETILKKCPNAIKYVYGTSTFQENEYSNIDISKKQYKISNLAGSKLINNALGHKHRQTIHKKQKLLSFYPIIFFRSSVQLPHLLDYGNNPLLQDKKDLFESFQFAIIIENSKQQHYFTEKLIDCLLMKTIPIYWGCPNISDYFDTTGWILLDNTNNIIQELKMKLFIIMTSNYYNEHLHTINHNYSTAIYYSDLYKNINMSSLTK